MRYDKRNLDNIEKLADHAKAAAKKWYSDVKKEGIEILVYETIRSKEQQAVNVRKGASQTMKSYHIVGQALDFVLVSVDGDALWDKYNSTDGKRVITLAKNHGFSSGQDWVSFKDSPHLQFAHKGYGTDTFGKWKPETPKKSKYPYPNVVFKEGAQAKYVGYIQKEVGVKVDNDFGPKTTAAVKVWQKKHNLKADGEVGPKTWKVMFGE